MGKSGKLFTTLVNGMKALKSPSTREKSTKENPKARKETDSSVIKQGCMWSLGKSASRNKSSAAASLHPGIEVKDVQVQQLSQGSQAVVSAFQYTDPSLDEITSTLVADIEREEPPPPHESYTEDWASILKLSEDESDPEEYVTHDTQPEEEAAVRIQAVIRRYLAQQNFTRVLKVVIKLQALARGRMVRKQAATTLRCIHALVRFQANARGWLVRTSEVGLRIRKHLEEMRLHDPKLLEGEFHRKQKMHHQAVALALDGDQFCMHSWEQRRSGINDFKPDKEYWGWAWLDRWMAVRPWENSSFPTTANKQSRNTARASWIGSINMVDEGPEIIVSNLERQNESMRGFQIDDFIVPASQKIPPPPPPPPPPLLSYIKASHPLIKDSVLCATEEPSESASIFPTCVHVGKSTSDSPTSGLEIYSPMVTPVVTKELSESASLCAPPIPAAVVTKLAFPNFTTERASSTNEGNLLLSTSTMALEASLPTLHHGAEPEENTSYGAPVDIEPLQADVPTLFVGLSSPPTSSVLQQRESPSSHSFTMKEEDRWQNGTPVPLYVADSQGEDGMESSEPEVNKDNLLKNESASSTDVMGAASEVLSFEKSTSDKRANSTLSNAEVGNITQGEENALNTRDYVAENRDDTREGCSPLKQNGSCDASMDSIVLSEAAVKRIDSILVKHEQGEGAPQRLPSYMATTKSSKAKARSQPVSPKLMPESPKQRFASPKHSLGSKRSPTTEGKGSSFVNAKQIAHVRSGSRGQLVSSLIKEGSIDSSFRSLGGSKRHAK